MPSGKSVSLILVAVLLGLVILAAALSYAFNGFIVDLWWFEALGYEQYFWLRLLYRYLVFVAAVGFFFLLFFVNFWIGAKYLGTRRPAANADQQAEGRPSRGLYKAFQRRSLALYLPLTLALAVIVSLPLFFYWERALMFLFAPDMGVGDAVFGLDIGFYLFSLPIYILLYAELAAALVVILLGLTLLYWLEHRTMPRERRRLRRPARIHLSVIAALLFLMGIAYLAGDALMLLYTDRHLPLFYGPGYDEMVVTLPLIAAAILLVLVIAGLFLWLMNRGKGAAALAVTVVLLAAVIGLRYTPAVTEAVHKYVVLPNELTRQAPYIANNIEATLDAYRLDDVETREYPIREEAWEEITPQIRLSLENIPIWDEEALLPVYRELQEIRPYYSFAAVDVDRYSVKDVYQQVFLAAREIDLEELRESLQTWVNRWLKYTHGYGIAMTPASQDAAKPIEWFIKGIPPDPVPGLEIDEPAIYYGSGGYYPVIAPNRSRELDYAARNQVQTSDYSGNGGVPVSGLYRKLMFALYFGERNIFYTTQTDADSKLLFRRNIRERIRTLTPFLSLDPNPYVVLAEGRLYWIQDALTTSDWFPYARPYEGHVEHFERPFNYIRESVKIIVDAFNGSVDYYIADPNDPIAAAYGRIYPGLFKPFDEMPTAIQEHLRYPKSMFDVQMDVYARYHQTDPETYYNQEDVWEFPRVEWREQMHRITSYYLTLNLIEADRFEYSLFQPLNPLGQRNMRALAVAGNDGDHYGRIIVYNFPKGTLVYGPAQVDAFIKQDPKITQELTLWQQEGSGAERGRMVVVPIRGVVTYIQGIFLQATAKSRMPQLARVIVSQGRLVVMESTLEDGFRALNAQIKEKREEEPTQKLPPAQEAPEVTPEATQDDTKAETMSLLKGDSPASDQASVTFFATLHGRSKDRHRAAVCCLGGGSVGHHHFAGAQKAAASDEQDEAAMNNNQFVWFGFRY